ncbi:MAG TPA: c-type cytochrome domain-containing protein, partial [Candidatus Eisenbacteria bacterium]|nr:c-type cytochrome domain-containing protein [Candidatus Eisenbacteria bacterium]
MKHYRSISGASLVMSALLLRAAEPVDFVKDIKPILEIACVKCHTAERHKGELRLDTKAGAFKGGEKGEVIVAGKPDKSPLYTSTILPRDHDDVMPPKKEGPLTKAQSELLRSWIEQGAAWPE